MFGLFGSKDEKKDGKKDSPKVNGKAQGANGGVKEETEPQGKNDKKSSSSKSQDAKPKNKKESLLGHKDKNESKKGATDNKDGSAKQDNKNLEAKAQDSSGKGPKTTKDGQNLREDDSGYHSRENSLEKPWSNKHKRCIMNDRWSPEDSVLNNREGLAEEITGRKTKDMCLPRKNRPKGFQSRDSSTDRSESGSSHRNSPVSQDRKKFPVNENTISNHVKEKNEKLVKRTKGDTCDKLNEERKREVAGLTQKKPLPIGDMPRPHPRTRSKLRSPAKSQMRQSSIDETPEEGEEDVTRSPWLKKSLTCSALLPPTTSAEDLLNSNSIEPGCRSGEDLQVTAIVHSEPSHNINNNHMTRTKSAKDLLSDKRLGTSAKLVSRAKTASPVLEVLSQGVVDPNDSPARKSKTFLHKINGWIQDHTMRAENKAEASRKEVKSAPSNRKLKLSHQNSAPEEMPSHPSMVKTPPSASPLHRVRPATKKLPKQMSLDSAKAMEVNKPTVRASGKSRSQPIPVPIPTPPTLSTPSLAPSSSSCSSAILGPHSETFSSPEEEFVDVVDEALMYELRAKERDAAAEAETAKAEAAAKVGHRKTARDVKRSRSFKDIFRGRSKSRGRDRDLREKEHDRQRKIVDSYDLRVERVDLRTRFGLPPLHNKVGRRATVFSLLLDPFFQFTVFHQLKLSRFVCY